ncbi:MAG: glycosyltransferase [Eubacterium sp.]|nr:glycosyltransferase [Eubacterium sp.]
MNKLLTVFTPTYNRAHTLPVLYESLKAQEDTDFIWLIIDDGSSDGTEELVRNWMKEGNPFEIRYVYKENGGMHTAHNTAYEMIDTELNVCIDSDDALAPGAVRLIRETWDKVCGRGYAGIIGLDADTNGRIIGKGFPEGLSETTLSGYYENGGAGDKKLVYRTDVMREMPPYPVFAGEKYVGLNTKYTLCDQEYQLYVLPAVLCIVDYQADGSSAAMWKQYLRNPNGFAYLRRIDLTYRKSAKVLLKTAIHYDASCLLAGKNGFLADSPRPLLTALLLPLGCLLAAVTRVKGKD